MKAAEKEAEEQRKAAIAAKWKQLDAEAALKQEKDRSAEAAKSWKEACERSNATLAASRAKTQKKKDELAKLQGEISRQNDRIQELEEALRLQGEQSELKDKTIVNMQSAYDSLLQSQAEISSQASSDLQGLRDRAERAERERQYILNRGIDLVIPLPCMLIFYTVPSHCIDKMLYIGHSSYQEKQRTHRLLRESDHYFRRGWPSEGF